MKKKQIANLIMVVIILVIAAAGVLGVGYIQGWFDADDGETAHLSNIWGIVNLEREGVSFPVSDETALRPGDKLTCDPGASARICLNEGHLALSNSASLTVTDPAMDHFSAEVTAGEVFVHAMEPVSLAFDGRTVDFTDATALLSVRSGAQSVSVYGGSLADAGAGAVIDWIGGEKTVSALSVNSLNDFAIGQIGLANDTRELVFSDEDLDRLQADREAALQEQLNQTEPAETEPAETTAPTEPATEAPEKPTEQPDAPKPTEGRADPKPTQPPVTEPPATEPPATEPKPTCTITIRCDTILDNLDDLDPAKAGFVPGSGVILSTKTVTFTEGETVFDVLSRVCSVYGIQLEYSWTPMYNSYYIEGINNLYEFDCGSESGWMYKVNGWFPNYGCSGYTLSDGDSIVWCFTCVGLGADVGA